MLSEKSTAWNAAMSDKTPLESIRDHLQSVLDIMAETYPVQLGNNSLIETCIKGAWGEIIDDTRPKTVSPKTWRDNNPAPCVDRVALNEAICEFYGE